MSLTVVVAAIAKNESQHVRRWFASVEPESDAVFVVDTGSTDDTMDQFERAARSGKLCYSQFKFDEWSTPEEHGRCPRPFRFDVARNLVLSMIPRFVDVIVWVDLDEILYPGWRALVESAWTWRTTKLRFRAEWPDGPEESREYWLDRIHGPCHKWVLPVQEMLVPAGGALPTNVGLTNAILMRHMPDCTKPRGDLYMALLELARREHPHSARVARYLARELEFRGRCEEARAERERERALAGSVE